MTTPAPATRRHKAPVWLGPVVVLAVLVAILVAWRLLHPPHNPLLDEGKDIQNVGDFDAFQQSLATRVFQHFGASASGSDFSVIVATTAYPIGTLLRGTGSVPADLEDCVPKAPPNAFSAARLFPGYKMSSDTAVTANLGSRAILGLDSAGLKLSQASSVEYTIENTQIQIMDDKSVEAVTRQGECGRYIASHPGMRLVRGSVLGKISFTFKVDNPASAKAQLSKLGGVTIDDDPNSSTLTVSDDESEPIVELLSEFSTPPGDPKTAPTPKAVAGTPTGPVNNPGISSNHNVAILPPSNPASAPHLFVQQDAADAKDAGTNVVQTLRTDWPNANIESRVEHVPSEKMPGTAQVRYFNAADQAHAEKCVGFLKAAYPDIHAVRIGLPSPPGQMEVWLPKAGTAKTPQ